MAANPVVVMKRSDWETKIRARRDQFRAKQAPLEVPPAPKGPDHTGLRAIIYGAVWCKPCHQAKAYLQKRGVDVVEHDIEKHPKYATEMQRKMKRAGIRGGNHPRDRRRWCDLARLQPARARRSDTKSQARRNKPLVIAS